MLQTTQNVILRLENDFLETLKSFCTHLLKISPPKLLDSSLEPQINYYSLMARRLFNSYSKLSSSRLYVIISIFVQSRWSLWFPNWDDHFQIPNRDGQNRDDHVRFSQRWWDTFFLHWHIKYVCCYRTKNNVKNCGKGKISKLKFEKWRWSTITFNLKNWDDHQSRWLSL